MSTTLPRRSAAEMSFPRKSFTENSGRLEPTTPGAMAFSCGVAGLNGLAHANSPTKAKFSKTKQRLRIYSFLCIFRINSFNGAEASGFVLFLPLDFLYNWPRIVMVAWLFVSGSIFFDKSFGDIRIDQFRLTLL